MKICFSGPWDLDVPTNVVIFERQPSRVPPPHPDIEVMRAAAMGKLRQSFQEMCHSREGKL